MSEENEEWLRRLGDMISWMFYPDRRPGLLGTAEVITGTGGGRAAEPRRRGTGWVLVIDGAPSGTFGDPVQALEAITKFSFLPTTVVVTARIANLLFQGAVEHAEEPSRQAI